MKIESSLGGFGSRCGCGSSFCLDAGTGLADVHDHDIGGMGRAHTLRVLDVTEVQRVAERKSANVDFDRFWEIVGKAGDFDRVDVLLDHAAEFHARGFTIEVGWDVGGDFGFLVDGEEVGMHGGAGNRVVLDRLKECEAGGLAFDLEVDDDVFRAAVVDDLGECLGIDLEVDVLGAATIHHGRQPAFAAHLVEAAGAGAGAGCGFEECLFGHDGDGSLRLAPSAKVFGILKRGAGDLAARGALVKKLFDLNGKNPPSRSFHSANSVVIDRTPWIPIDETLESAVLTAINLMI